MRNSLPSLPDSTIITLIARGQARRMQVSLRGAAKPYIYGIALFIGMSAATYALCRPLLEPFAALGDTELIRHTFLPLIAFVITGLAAIFHCTVPVLVQHPQKHLAALPVTAFQWIWPQIRGLYAVALVVGHGVLTGCALAMARSVPAGGMLDLAHIPALGLPILWFGLGIGRIINSGAFGYGRRPGIANAAFAGLLFALLGAMQSSRGLETVRAASGMQPDVPQLALLITVSLAVTLCLFKMSSGAARTALAMPVRYNPPRPGRHIYPTTASGTYHPIVTATLRGLRHDVQAGFFALCTAAIAAASVIVAVRLNNPLFSSVIITNNATMVPLGLASWFTFARQKVGKNRSSIYKKPQSSIGLLILQALPVSTLALVTATLFTLITCRLLGTVPLADELIRLGGLAFVVALGGYICGVIAYPARGEHSSVLAAVILTFICAGLLLSADQPLRNRPLSVHVPAHVFTAITLLLCGAGIEKFSQKGLRT